MVFYLYYDKKYDCVCQTIDPEIQGNRLDFGVLSKSTDLNRLKAALTVLELYHMDPSIRHFIAAATTPYGRAAG